MRNALLATAGLCNEKNKTNGGFMKHGFVRVAAVTPKLMVADVKFNTQAIKEEILKMESKQVEVAVFPELCLCGYTCNDLFFQSELQEQCMVALREITEFTKNIPMLIFVGLPIVYEGKLYNCAAAICQGQVLGVVPKKNLPNYGEYCETRYFTPGIDAEDLDFLLPLWDEQHVVFGSKLIFRVGGNENVKIGCEICEDLWVANPPSNYLSSAGATIIVNLSASSEMVGKADYRRTIIKTHTGKNICAYVYANPAMTESTTDGVFSGHNIIAEYGTILSEIKPFEGGNAIAEIDVEFLANERKKRNKRNNDRSTKFNEIDTVDFLNDSELSLRDVSTSPFIPTQENNAETCEMVLSIQANALATRLSHIHAKTAVIGVSGGLDSTLALIATCRAFEILGKDKKDIIAITMPGFGTSGKTYQNSLELIRLMGATLREISIKDSVLQHFADIGHDPSVTDITYENAQARMRTLVLMDVANQTGGLVVGTGDLSELALGWCTYGGDHISMYSVNASVPKTLVRHLVSYVAGKSEKTLQEVLLSVAGTEISPELLPPSASGEIQQRTEDLVGPYELHDFYLYHIIRRACSPSSVFALAKYAFDGKYDDATLLKWLKNFYKRFFAQQFKRSCMPDGVKVGSVTLSPRTDWRMPSDAASTLWTSEVDELMRKAGLL